MEKDLWGRYGEDNFSSDPTAFWEQITADRKEVVVLDKNYLQKQLFEVSLESSGTVAEYLVSINSIIDTIRTCDVTITNGEKWFTIINGLPATCSIFISIAEGVIETTQFSRRRTKAKSHKNERRKEKRSLRSTLHLEMEKGGLIYKFSLGDTRKVPGSFHHGNQISAQHQQQRRRTVRLGRHLFCFHS